MASVEETAEPPGRQTHTAISIRVTHDFKNWLTGLANHNRLSRAATLEHGLYALARSSGFDRPAPLR